MFVMIVVTVITLANHYATDFDVNVVTFKVVVATKDLHLHIHIMELVQVTVIK